LEERLHRTSIDISLENRVARQFWKPRGLAILSCPPCSSSSLGKNEIEAENEKLSFLESYSTNSTSTGTSM
jgi:hypothetical protein